MADLEKFEREDWEAMYLLGRISQKLGVKKGQTITGRIGEVIDVVQSCYAVTDQPAQMTEALNRLNRPGR